MTTQRIDATWAAFFGLSPPAFLLPGVQVVAHHELADYQGVWLFRHHHSLCISVPPDLVEGIQAVVGGCTVESLWDLGSNKSLGRHTRASSSGRIFDLPLIPESVRWARRIRRHWGSWADACDVEAWEHAGIAVDEPHAFGCFVDGHLAAVARYRAAWGETAHIGVVTHPAYRGRRYGSAVMSAATAQALEAGFIVLYQTLLANAPSVSLATGLARFMHERARTSTRPASAPAQCHVLGSEDDFLAKLR